MPMWRCPVDPAELEGRCFEEGSYLRPDFAVVERVELRKGLLEDAVLVEAVRAGVGLQAPFARQRQLPRME